MRAGSLEPSERRLERDLLGAPALVQDLELMLDLLEPLEQRLCARVVVVELRVDQLRLDLALLTLQRGDLRLDAGDPLTHRAQRAGALVTLLRLAPPAVARRL